MDEGRGVSREPLSVVAIHQDDEAFRRARRFYQMIEQEFGDDFCFDCVHWPLTALQSKEAEVTHDASEADLILLALGEQRDPSPLPEMSGWLRHVREVRHAPFSLVCLTDDPLLASGRVHGELQGLASHFSMVYLEDSQSDSTHSQDERGSAVTLSPVLFERLVRVDPHLTGGIND